MVHRILQLKQSNSAIYAHEIRSELQKEFGKLVDGNYIGPVVPSVSSINRILRTNSDPSTLNENSGSQLSSTGQLSSFYYPQHFAAPSSALASSIAPKHLPSYAPSSSAAPSSFGNLYDPFSAVNGLAKGESAWPNSSLSSNSSFSSGYSSSYSSGSNSPVSSSSSGSSSPTEFDTYSFGSSLKGDSNLPSHYHASSSAHLSLLNGLLSKPSTGESGKSMSGEPATFGSFHRPSQTSLQSMNGLQQSSSKSSLYYSMAGASSSLGSLSSKKRSRKYNSYHIHEILRKSDEEDIDEEEDLNVVNDE